MLSQFLNGYATLFCVFSGTILNAFCIYIFVWYHRGAHNSSGGGGTPIIQTYIITLTIWQSALLCNAFLLYCLPTLIYGHIISQGSYVYLYPFVYALANTTHTGTVWVILTLTIDRYLALCQPLKHQRIGKQNRVRRLMIGVSLAAVLYSAPRFFEVSTVRICRYTSNGSFVSFSSGVGDFGTDYEPLSVECLPTVIRTALTRNEAYWTAYHIVMALLFVTLVPCLLLFALTVRISMALGQARVQRRKMTMSGGAMHKQPTKTTAKNKLYTKKEHKANVMLVVVIVKFLASDILPTVLDVIEQFLGSNSFMTSSYATLCVDFSNFLLVLNCSTNFWVFLLWGHRFRQNCRLFLSDCFILKRWLRLKAGSGSTPANTLYSYCTGYLGLGGAGILEDDRSPPHLSEKWKKKNSGESTGTTTVSNSARSGRETSPDKNHFPTAKGGHTSSNGLPSLRPLYCPGLDVESSCSSSSRPRRPCLSQKSAYISRNQRTLSVTQQFPLPPEKYDEAENAGERPRRKNGTQKHVLFRFNTSPASECNDGDGEKGFKVEKQNPEEEELALVVNDANTSDVQMIIDQRSIEPASSSSTISHTFVLGKDNANVFRLVILDRDHL